jgi:general stress protein 26
MQWPGHNGKGKNRCQVHEGQIAQQTQQPCTPAAREHRPAPVRAANFRGAEARSSGISIGTCADRVRRSVSSPQSPHSHLPHSAPTTVGDKRNFPAARQETTMTHTPQDLEKKFWKSLKSDMTLMLGLDGAEDGHTRPMTAQLDGEAHGPIWFFTSTDSQIAQQLSAGTIRRATAAFSSKGHDLFASIQGSVRQDNDRAVIERLWNPFIAAWFEGGKDDPKLALLRFDAENAEIWLNASSLVSGVKMLLGIDPKKDYKDKVAQVSLR